MVREAFDFLMYSCVCCVFGKDVCRSTCVEAGGQCFGLDSLLPRELQGLSSGGQGGLAATLTWTILMAPRG